MNGDYRFGEKIDISGGIANTHAVPTKDGWGEMEFNIKQPLFKGLSVTASGSRDLEDGEWNNYGISLEISKNPGIEVGLRQVFTPRGKQNRLEFGVKF